MSERLDSRRFPQLTDQVRTSTGFTQAPGGVLRLPPGWGDMPRRETPVARDITVAPKIRKRPARRARGDI